MRRLFLWLLLLSVAGCGDDTAMPDPLEPPATPGCVPGELLLDDGSCRAAGLPPDLPPPGPETPPQAGVPAGGCHEGFASDGEGGCTPILPREPCASGAIAVPGDSACREIAACGAAPWGEIPLDPGAEFVDGAFLGQSDGSAAFPWKTVQEAIDAAAPNDMVAIAAGTYSEDLVFADKPVRLWGRCPALVSVVGIADQGPAIEISIAGVELHTLAVTGIGHGVEVNDPGGAALDRVWLHDLDGPGLVLYGGSETTEVEGSLIERTVYGAVVAEAARLRFERSETRHPQVLADGTTGLGLHVVPDRNTEAPSEVVISGSNIHHNVDFGIVLALSSLELTGTVVHDSQPGTVGYGYGLLALGDPTPCTVSIEGSVFSSHRLFGMALQFANATIATTTIEDTVVEPRFAYGHGLYIDSSDVTMVESVVRDTVGMGLEAFVSDIRLTRTLVQRVSPNTQSGELANAAVAAYDWDAPSTLEIEECVLEDSVENGILLFGSDAFVRGSILRDIQPTPVYPYAAGVLAIYSSDLDRESRVLVDHSLLEHNSGSGIAALASDVTLTASIVRDTQLSSVGDYGQALLLSDLDVGAARGTVYGSLIEGAHERGIAVSGSELDLEATIVRAVEPAPNGASGRGIELSRSNLGRRASGSIRWSVVEDVHDAALFVWSGDVEVRGVLIRNVTAVPSDTGYGIAITGGPEGQRDPSHALIVGSHIEHTHTTGIGIDSSYAEITGTLVRDIETSPLDDRRGYCAFAQWGSTLIVTASLMERCASAGIGLQTSTGTIRDTIVRDVRPNGKDLLGDGVVVIAGEAALGPLQVERVARAAVSSFGAHIALHDATLLCSALDIAVESTPEAQASVDDGGANRCGCPSPARACEAVSAGLAPPEAITPPL